MIRKFDKLFVLQTAHTTYCFRILPTGQAEHIYYGRRIRIEKEQDAEAICRTYAFAGGNTLCYDKDHMNYSLEEVCLEMSTYGKGDIREPFLELVNADGSLTNDFQFCRAEIKKGKAETSLLPNSYGTEKEVETLTIYFEDQENMLNLELNYFVYELCDVITRNAVLRNPGEKSWIKAHELEEKQVQRQIAKIAAGYQKHEEIKEEPEGEPVIVNRMMSAQLDFPERDYIFTTFTGSWTNEMNRHDTKVTAGKQINASFTGTSSNRANPFIILSKDTTTEDHGDCFGMNLVYSGNHYESLEAGTLCQTTRLTMGINPQAFSWKLNAGESFETPEAVMTYSADGFGGMSRQMQRFVQHHIIRGIWKEKERPVLLNSWEAFYFNFKESSLLSLAKKAKEIGAELFVLDDGWFGVRNNDTCSLGDWRENLKKLPRGLNGLAEKVKALGLAFGIWVEPEMVNVDSELYREHPEWVIDTPGKAHSEGRNQRLLDLTRTEVQDYIIKEMSKVFSSADISYVKWDFNRNFSDIYSKALSKEREGEVLHRYVLGLYRIMDTLTKKYPDILFEGCASGGNRFDLGILSYFPQIWGSDNTDAICRANIQTGYSYGYPQSAVGAHVSTCPNHQTLRKTSLETRFAIAAFGALGYEYNLRDASKEELAQMKQQIETYKKWRRTLQFGQFYRGRTGNILEWTCVSPDKKQAVGMQLQLQKQPNQAQETFWPKGLNPEYYYHFSNHLQKLDIRDFGSLINTMSPVHIKQDSALHDIAARFVKLSDAKEEYTAYGDAMMYAGVKLKPAFAGSGYNEQIRYAQDFTAKLYFIEKQ